MSYILNQRYCYVISWIARTEDGRLISGHGEPYSSDWNQVLKDVEKLNNTHYGKVLHGAGWFTGYFDDATKSKNLEKPYYVCWIKGNGTAGEYAPRFSTRSEAEAYAADSNKESAGRTLSAVGCV